MPALPCPVLPCCRRLELVQDYGFPNACQRIKATPDGNYIYGSGYHPPSVRATHSQHNPCTQRSYTPYAI